MREDITYVTFLSLAESLFSHRSALITNRIPPWLDVMNTHWLVLFSIVLLSDIVNLLFSKHVYMLYSMLIQWNKHQNVSLKSYYNKQFCNESNSQEQQKLVNMFDRNINWYKWQKYISKGQYNGCNSIGNTMKLQHFGTNSLQYKWYTLQSLLQKLHEWGWMRDLLQIRRSTRFVRHLSSWIFPGQLFSTDPEPYPLSQREECYIDGSVQERRNSSALAMELRLSCTDPSISDC